MKRTTFGFSLVELMLTLAIAAILITLAAPGFRAMIQNNRLTAHANQFVAAAHLARSEAVKRREDVQLVATDATDTGNEWGPGWSVSTVLTQDALEDGITFDSAGNFGSYTFDPTGRVNTTDTLTLCDDRRQGVRSPSP